MSPPSNPWPCRLFNLDRAALTPLEVTLLRTAAFLTLTIIYLSLHDARGYAGSDFRNRVVGARVMLAGYDPYSFTWESGMPEEWLDPVHDPKAHRLTVPPPTLWLYALIAPLPYLLQRQVSFVCEWAALLASIILLARVIPAQRTRVVFLLGSTLFIVASTFWRMHLELGQIYVAHLLALSIAISFLSRYRLDTIAGGCALGVLGLMRPNLLLFAPALLVLGRWRTAMALCGTVGAFVLATMPLMHPDTWPSFFRVGDSYYRALWAPETLPDLPRPPQDIAVEGVVFCHSHTAIESSSFPALYQHWQEEGKVPKIDLGLVGKAGLLSISLLLLGVLWSRRRGVSAAAALALMVTLSLDTEFFLPHRWAYAEVLLLPPLALLLPAMLQPGRENRQVLAIVLLALILGEMGTAHGERYLPLLTSTMLRSWLVMGALTALALKNVRGVDSTTEPILLAK